MRLPSRIFSSRLRLEALEDRTLPSTVTTLADSGPGSLRDLVAQAAPGDTIDFDPGLAGGTIFLTTGQIAVTRDLTIQGLGPDALTISGNHTSSIFSEPPRVNLAVSDLTLADGNTTSPGGAVSALGSLTLTRVDLLRNTSGADGGGVYFAPPASASLTLDSCLIDGNVALNGAGVNAIPPPAFVGDVAVTVTDCTIQNNRTTTSGGGVSGFGCGLNLSFDLMGNGTGTTTIADSTFQGNTGNLLSRTVYGAGLAVRLHTSSNAQATANLTGLTIAGNMANVAGGLFLYSDQSTGGSASALVENCTIANNVAQGTLAGSGHGGGIYVYANQVAGAVIHFCTVTGNRATQGEGTLPDGGGVYQGTLIRPLYTLSNSIVALNQGGTSPDVDGPIHSLGYNLVSDRGRSTGWDVTDQVGNFQAPLDPKLAPLGDYGGPTRTMPPLPGSPALDAGDPDSAPATDQRGVARDNNVNIGAFQATASHLTVTAPAIVAPGQVFLVAVAALDDFGQLALGYTGTVDLQSSDPLASDLGSHAFTTDDAGQYAFSATLFTEGSVDLTASDGSLEGTTNLLVIPGGHPVPMLLPVPTYLREP
jgi:hypothetical protein